MATISIINHRKANLQAAGVTLRPGENVLGEEKARVFFEDKQAALWKDIGWVGIKPAKKAVSLEAELAAGASDDDDGGSADTEPPGPVTAKDTIDFVATETDVSALEGMLRDESRKTVTSAIERRLEELSEPADGDSEASDGGEG